MNLITSSQNAVIKDIKSLKNRKGRNDKGLFYVEGTRIVDEAIKENEDIAEIIISETFAAEPYNERLLSRLGLMEVKLYFVTDKLFKELSDTETPQGILAVMKIKNPDPGKIVGNKGLFIILDSIRDPGNMGTIIRTADAAGFSGVMVSKGCVDVFNPKVLRSTMGSIFHIPIYQYNETADAILFIKSKGIKVLASHLEGSISVFDARMGEGAAIIIGNEAEGISKEVVNMADTLVRIPMAGRAESLNASVAAGILMYEALRQRLDRK